MKGTRQLGEELFFQRFRQIERAVRIAAAQHRLSVEERQELYSLVMLKMVQEDYSALRGFQGRCRWGTYLSVIVQRVLLDQRIKEWGRWRPSSQARRLGPVAVQLDQRINRDGQDPPDAIRELLAQGAGKTANELEDLAAQIPRRLRRQFLTGDTFLKNLADRDQTSNRVESAENQRTATHLQKALTATLRDLPAHERRLLHLRFHQGWTVRRIARNQNLEERSLYRRFKRILQRLRHHLEQLDLGWQDIATALDGREIDLEVDLQ